MKYSDEVRAAFLSRGTLPSPTHARAFLPDYPLCSFASSPRRTQTTAFDGKVCRSLSVSIEDRFKIE